MALLSVGTMAFDSIETPHGKADRIIGGSATYVAWAASHFCKPIHQVSIIGADFPQQEIKELEARGVDFKGVERVETGKSFYWSGRYHDDMNHRDTLITELNVLTDFNPQLPTHYKQPKVAMLGNLAPSVQLMILNQLEHRPDLVVLDTMNFWMDTALDDLWKVLEQIDVLVINDSEVRQLAGTHSLVKAARIILEMGPNSLIIKKGEHGALLFHQDQIFSAPAMPLAEVFDPTGAGDVFAGGFVGYLAHKGIFGFEELKTAVIVGSVMASFCVEEFGVERLKTIKREELQQRMHYFKKFTEFSLPKHL